MTLKDWTDLLTGGGAIISAIAAGVAAWASRTSAKAAEQSSKATRETLVANERIANNDWRIRLMDERMRVWREFDNLLREFISEGVVSRSRVFSARQVFSLASFLFDPEIKQFLDDTCKELYKFHNITVRMERCQKGLQEGSNNKNELTNSLKELWDQRDKISIDIDRKYDIGVVLFRKHMSLLDKIN